MKNRLKGFLYFILGLIGIPLYFTVGVLQAISSIFIFTLEGINRGFKFYKRDLDFEYLVNSWDLACGVFRFAITGFDYSKLDR